MKVLLMHPGRDFDIHTPLPWNETTLTQDLELNTLLYAMADGDKFIYDVCRAALFAGFDNDIGTILYRQAVLRDCLASPELVKTLYALTVEATESTKRLWWDLSSHYPSSVLFGADALLEALLGMLQRLRQIADESQGRVHSPALTKLLATIQSELNDDYLAAIGQHLADLKFPNGTLLIAQLGENSEGADYALARPPASESHWIKRLFAKAPSGYRFHLAPQDEAGARILSGMRQRGIARVAAALAQSAQHVLGFFKMLRTELAFYVGALNLHEKLAVKGEPICFPVPCEAGTRIHRFRGLYDVCLSLSLESRVVGNSLDSDGRGAVIITGANRGGKSSFLRGIGVAQMMMQCGVLVGAEYFEAEVCPFLFTHYKREEDATMKQGKLDEELARMGDIASHIAPNALLLLNESFAATNEREGSEIAGQIVRAMLEKGIRVLFVTHLYSFAHQLFESRAQSALFLMAERLPDGTRTFKLIEHEPLETSYGEDLYREIFHDVFPQLGGIPR